MVLLTRRHAPAGDDHIERRSGVGQHDLHALGVVGQRGPRGRLQALGAQQAHQQVAVAVVDLPGPQRQAGFHQFVAGGEHGHRGAPCHRQRRQAQGCGQSDPRGGQHLALAHHLGTCGHVLADTPHIRARPYACRDLDATVCFDDVFTDGDRVGALGQRRACRDADAFAGTDAQPLGHTRVLLSHQPQACRALGSEAGMRERHAVHPAVVERRQVDRRANRIGQHAAAGTIERERLATQAARPRRVPDQRDGFIDGDAGGVRAHLRLTCRIRRRFLAICFSVSTFFLPS